MAFRSRPLLLIAHRRPLDTGDLAGAPLAARIMAGLDGDCTPGIQHPPALSAIITWLIDTGWPVRWASPGANEKRIVGPELTLHPSLHRCLNSALRSLHAIMQRHRMEAPTTLFADKAF